MDFGIGFNNHGQFTAFPSIFVNINADNLALRSQGPTGVVAILGKGSGFTPPKVATSLNFDTRSPQRLISPSELLSAAELAVRPFSELDRGATAVFVIPVSPATQSAVTLHSVTPTNLVTLTSKGWGPAFNTIQWKKEVISAVQTLTLLLPTAGPEPIIETYRYATIVDLVAQITARSGLVNATFLAEGTVVDSAYTAMTGGTEPDPTTTDWADALAAMNGIRMNCLSVVTDDPAIWAMLSDYCISHRARGFIGSDIKNWNGIASRQNSISTLKSEAAALNAFRMMHCALGCDGFPGYIYASRYAALAGALDPSTPMTFKHLDASSLETVLDVPSEVGGVDGLLLAGLAPPVLDPANPSSPLLSRGLGTFTGDDNLYHREHSILAAVDGITDTLEATLRKYLGAEATPAVVQRSVNDVAGVFEDAKKPTSAIRIVDYDPKAIIGTFSKTVLNISARITPIQPINFIPVSLGLDDTQITVTVNVPLAGAGA